PAHLPSPPTPPATPTRHTLSLHAALPIYHEPGFGGVAAAADRVELHGQPRQRSHRRLRSRADIELRVQRGVHVPQQLRYSGLESDRKSTRLNSSHVKISYAVFCLKKKTMD